LLVGEVAGDDQRPELCMKPGRILNAIRAAFVRMIWTATWGVSDPAG
jgi:hypothetical protein